MTIASIDIGSNTVVSSKGLRLGTVIDYLIKGSSKNFSRSDGYPKILRVLCDPPRRTLRSLRLGFQ